MALNPGGPEDLLEDRIQEIIEIVQAHIEVDCEADWEEFIEFLPRATTLMELRDYLWADNQDQQIEVLKSVHSRLGEEMEETELQPARVRIMTMHGAKGLSTGVVFIPGLEDAIMPGQKRARVPGLVLEAARLLYVSITRARVGCVLSYARTRITFGDFGRATPSRFCNNVGGAFTDRTSGLSDPETQRIKAAGDDHDDLGESDKCFW